jgi:hypothetical protein
MVDKIDFTEGIVDPKLPNPGDLVSIGPSIKFPKGGKTWQRRDGIF